MLILPSQSGSGAVLGEPVGARGLRGVVDVLGMEVLRQPGGALLAPEAGLLEAAPLRLGEVRAEVVDPDGAVAQTRCDALRPARVLRPDRTREAVDRVVREYHGLVLGREGLDRDDRAEALVLDDGHAG